ncbi:MAG: DUF4235 domain-containing protein [Actinomycetes bacterium]
MDNTDVDLEDLSGDGTADVQVEVEVNPIMHLIAPIAAIAVTIVVRNLINKGYEKSTGKKPPEARDPRVSAVRAILWTATITTAAAVAEVAVYRIINKVGAERKVVKA